MMSHTVPTIEHLLVGREHEVQTYCHLKDLQYLKRRFMVISRVVVQTKMFEQIKYFFLLYFTQNKTFYPRGKMCCFWWHSRLISCNFNPNMYLCFIFISYVFLVHNCYYRNHLMYARVRMIFLQQLAITIYFYLPVFQTDQLLIARP